MVTGTPARKRVDGWPTRPADSYIGQEKTGVRPVCPQVFCYLFFLYLLRHFVLVGVVVEGEAEAEVLSAEFGG